MPTPTALSKSLPLLAGCLFAAFAPSACAQSPMGGLVEGLEAMLAARQKMVDSESLISSLLPNDPFHVADVSWCGNNNSLISSGGSDKAILLWDTTNRTVVRALDRASGSRAIACDRRARLVATGSGAALRLWDLNNRDKTQDIPGPFPLDNDRNVTSVKALFFSANNRFLHTHWQHVIPSDRNRIEQRLVTYNLETFKAVGEVSLSSSIPAWQALRPALSRKGVLYAYAHGDTSAMYISVVAPLSGRKTIEFRSEDLLPNATAFGLDDDTVLIAGRLQNTSAFGRGEYAVTEYSIRERKHVRSFVTGHIENIHAIAYRQHSDILITAAGDKTVELRKYSTGNLLKTLGDRKNPVYSIAVQPDGNQFVSAGGVINIWPLTIQ